MEAWTRPGGYWLATSRAYPHSTGWPEAKQQRVTALRDRERDMAIAIVTHRLWSMIDTGDQSGARDALKRVLEENENSEAAA